MDRRDYHASCAVCNGPADPDCPSGCESNRLNMAIAQAEKQWLEKWTSETREWVANHAIRYVTSTFQAMKDGRLANHHAYVKALPYFAIYEQYHGRPPLHPGALRELQRQIAEADLELRRSIDADWRQCVIRYPDVLAHFYSMVNIVRPKEVTPPASLIPPVPHLLPQTKPAPIERARSTTGTSTTKKARRNSKASSTKGGDLALEAMAKLLGESHLNASGHSKGTIPNGLSAGLGHSGLGGHMGNGVPASMSRGLSSSFMDGISSSYSRGASKGLQNELLNGAHDPNMLDLTSLEKLMRTPSKAGKTTPVQDTPHARPTGKKRHSGKDFMTSNGRATAPLPHAPYAPPGKDWINENFVV